MYSNSDPMGSQASGAHSGMPAAGTGGSSGYYAVPGQEDTGMVTDYTTAGQGLGQGLPSSASSARGEAYEIDIQGAACRPSPGQTLAAILGGAGIGAALMYLLDPDEGPQRRHYLGKYAHGAWDVLRERAGELGHSAYEGAGTLKERVAHSRLGEEAFDRARYLVRGRESHGIESGLGQLFAGVGILASGVAATYFFDPDRGAQRRAQCTQRLTSAFNRMFRSLDSLGRDLWNRTQGVVHESRMHPTREQVEDRVLIERVRAEIGHCVSNAGAIDVNASNGTVTVTGFVTPAEHDDLLKCIWGVRGVQQLINRLEIQPLDRNLASTGGVSSGASGAASGHRASSFTTPATSTTTTTTGAACPPGLGTVPVPSPNTPGSTVPNPT